MHPETLLAPAIAAAGWLGQACFFTRFFVQWLASERARRSVVPRSFWWLSLCGSVLMSAYALRQGTMLLLFGFAVGALISVRNLLLARGAAGLGARHAAWIGLVLGAGLIGSQLADQHFAHAPSGPWLVVGTVGQALWLARFPLQWWLSERSGRSQFTPAFWWLSLTGNTLLLAYALHLGDPVFVLGFLPGPLLQARNLVLGRERRARA